METKSLKLTQGIAVEGNHTYNGECVYDGTNHLRVDDVEALVDVADALIKDIEDVQSKHLHAYLHAFKGRFKNKMSRMDNMRVHVNEFEKLEKIGQGGVGDVFHTKHRITHASYAMKILNKDRMISVRALPFVLTERNALVKLKCSRWVTDLIASFQDDNNLYLVMEYIPGGSLADYIWIRKDNPIKENEAIFYVAQITSALEYIHSNGIIHRDIKPENLLVCNKGNIKIADFGSCIFENEFHLSNEKEIAGTVNYSAPEILSIYDTDEIYGFECDYWSMGVIIYEMLFNKHPFEIEDETALINSIIQMSVTYDDAVVATLSSEALHFIKNLLISRTLRLGFNGHSEVKAHPWLNSINWNNFANMTPPFIPEGTETIDYFNSDLDSESEKTFYSTTNFFKNNKNITGRNLLFAGYYYYAYSNRHIPLAHSPHLHLNISDPSHFLTNPNTDLPINYPVISRPDLRLTPFNHVPTSECQNLSLNDRDGIVSELIELPETVAQSAVDCDQTAPSDVQPVVLEPKSPIPDEVIHGPEKVSERNTVAEGEIVKEPEEDTSPAQIISAPEKVAVSTPYEEIARKVSDLVCDAIFPIQTNENNRNADFSNAKTDFANSLIMKMFVAEIMRRFNVLANDKGKFNGLVPEYDHSVYEDRDYSNFNTLVNSINYSDMSCPRQHSLTCHYPNNNNMPLDLNNYPGYTCGPSEITDNDPNLDNNLKKCSMLRSMYTNFEFRKPEPRISRRNAMYHNNNKVKKFIASSKRGNKYDTDVVTPTPTTMLASCNESQFKNSVNRNLYSDHLDNSKARRWSYNDIINFSNSAPSSFCDSKGYIFYDPETSDKSSDYKISKYYQRGGVGIKNALKGYVSNIMKFITPSN